MVVGVLLLRVFMRVRMRAAWLNVAGVAARLDSLRLGTRMVQVMRVVGVAVIVRQHGMHMQMGMPLA